MSKNLKAKILKLFDLKITYFYVSLTFYTIFIIKTESHLEIKKLATEQGLKVILEFGNPEQATRWLQNRSQKWRQRTNPEESSSLNS